MSIVLICLAGLIVFGILAAVALCRAGAQEDAERDEFFARQRLGIDPDPSRRRLDRSSRWET